MEGMRYKIADLIVDMEPHFEMLASRAAPYRYEGGEAADININISVERIKQLHKINPTLSAADCEYMLAGSDFYYSLLLHDGFLIHASSVVLEGQAYLFSAPCGTGKSTHTGLWLKAFSNAEILNDDKPAIRYINGSLYAYGTPFSGKHDISKNMRADLRGIAFIERDEKNSIERIGDTAEALRRTLEQTIRPSDPKRLTQLLDYMDALIKKIPIYLLKCNMNEEAAFVAYEGMREHEA